MRADPDDPRALIPAEYALLLILASRRRYRCSFRTLIDLSLDALLIPGNPRQQRDRIRHEIKRLESLGALRTTRTGKQTSEVSTSLSMARRYWWSGTARAILNQVPARNTTERVAKIATWLDINERSVWNWFAPMGAKQRAAPRPYHLREVVQKIWGATAKELWVPNVESWWPWVNWIEAINYTLGMSVSQQDRIARFWGEFMGATVYALVARQEDQS